MQFLRKHLYTFAFCILTSNQFFSHFPKIPFLQNIFFQGSSFYINRTSSPPLNFPTRYESVCLQCPHVKWYFLVAVVAENQSLFKISLLRERSHI